MAIETKPIRIKDVDYTITKMPTSRSVENFGTLAKFFGGPIGTALAAGEDAEISVMGPALKELADHLASPDLLQFIYKMLDGASANGLVLINGANRTVFEGHFAGELDSLAMLVWFGIKENYSSFLDGVPGLKTLITENIKKVPTLQKSPKVSTKSS